MYGCFPPCPEPEGPGQLLWGLPSVVKDVLVVARGGLGVRYGIVSGCGLGKLLRHHADRLDGRLAHAAAPVFGLEVGRIGEAVHKEDLPVCMLESRGKAGLLVTAYYIPTSVG